MFELISTCSFSSGVPFSYGFFFFSFSFSFCSEIYSKRIGILISRSEIMFFVFVFQFGSLNGRFSVQCKTFYLQRVWLCPRKTACFTRGTFENLFPDVFPHNNIAHNHNNAYGFLVLWKYTRARALAHTHTHTRANRTETKICSLNIKIFLSICLLNRKIDKPSQDRDKYVHWTQTDRWTEKLATGLLEKKLQQHNIW